MKKISNNFLRFAEAFPIESAVALIKLYRRLISPLFPPSCRYYPSCSDYAMQAFRTHGIFKGTRLSVWRILRCNPFGKGGHDPVPPAATKKSLGKISDVSLELSKRQILNSKF